MNIKTHSAPTMASLKYHTVPFELNNEGAVLQIYKED